MTPISDSDALRNARQEAMVTALRDAFGARALEVARRQLALAEGETFDTWQGIVVSLGG